MNKPTLVPLFCLALVLQLLFTTRGIAQSPLPTFDFTDPAVCAQWGQPHDISALRATSEGLEIAISGTDPYFSGPSRDYPSNALWLDLKLRSESGGDGQVFWFTGNATEENSLHFGAGAGEWTNIRLALPPLGKGYRLRIDPPGTSGRCTLASARFFAQSTWSIPKFPAAVPPGTSHVPPEGVTNMRLVSDGWGGIEILSSKDSKQILARSHNRALIGYVRDGKPVWFAPGASMKPSTDRESMLGRMGVASDPDGGKWSIKQRFVRDNVKHATWLESTVSVDQDREVLFLPIIFLVSQHGNTNKQQAIFPGLEYLDNEPSSSEADLIGPAAQRYVPDPKKITQPYLALLASNRWFSVSWTPNPSLVPFFDSPDRTFGSGGHVMGLLYPGFSGRSRTDGRWLPNEPVLLKAGQEIAARILVNTGTGDSIQPAIEAYVQREGFPPMPEKTPAWQEYFKTVVGGWLDSKDREGNLLRHAVWEGFRPQPAADAAAFMEWLSCQTEDRDLTARLISTSAQVLSAVPPAQWAFAQVSHIRLPVAPLVYGHVAENQRQARNHAEHLLGRLTPAGYVAYRITPNGTDYGRTYYTNHANGLTAQVTSTLLDAAVFNGDQALIRQALDKVRAMKTLYHGGVPRGAQTWEVPLHTPDILASAYLVRANAIAYELTGDKNFLDEANYWAWTGVPFVYLVNPVGKDIGTYGTIAVYGATGWRAPVWMGLPVQWCGLVYADALYRLGGEAVPGVSWQKLADGVTAAGIQMTWPVSDKDRQGLLPDSFLLREQKRDGPAINPGTVQPCAARFYRKLPVYDCMVIRGTGVQPLIVHAPGEIALEPRMSNAGHAEFTVNLWPRHAAWVLINGIRERPKMKLNGQDSEVVAPHEYDSSTGSLRLNVQGRARVQLN